MNEKKFSVLALVALILQAIMTLIGIIMVIMQKTLLPKFYGQLYDADRMIFPSAPVFMVLMLAIYFIFFFISREEGNKTGVILLVVFAVLISLLNGFVNTLVIRFYSRFGTEAVAAYTALTSLISSIHFLGLPASVLFYVACGRYTACE
jgi:hypothetical protein